MADPGISKLGGGDDGTTYYKHKKKIEFIIFPVDPPLMYIQWTRVLFSVVITQQSNPSISQFNSLCNEFTSFWSMFV